MLIEIGQMARMLGITVNGVRFLEREGLVSPTRDEGNGYRQFSLEDQATLYMYKLYRMAGLNMTDIKEALTSEPNEAVRVMRRSVAEQRRILYECECAADKIEEFLDKGMDAPRFELAARPELHCVPYPVYQGEAVTSASASLFSQQYNYLIEHMPSSFFGITFRRDAEGPGWSAERNIVITDDTYTDLAEPVLSHVERFPARDRCLHAIVRCTSEEGDERFLHEPLAWLEEQGLAADDGDIVARFLYGQKLDDRLAYRLEMWVPVRP